MDIKTVLDIGSALITIIGLPILILTLWLLIRQLRIQAYQAIYQSSISMDQYLAEHSEIRPYIFDGKEMPLEGIRERDEVIGSVIMLAAFFEHVTGQKPSMSKDKWRGWENYMRDIYDTSPTMRYCVKKYEKWHSREFLEMLHRRKDS